MIKHIEVQSKKEKPNDEAFLSEQRSLKYEKELFKPMKTESIDDIDDKIEKKKVSDEMAFTGNVALEIKTNREAFENEEDDSPQKSNTKEGLQLNFNTMKKTKKHAEPKSIVKYEFTEFERAIYLAKICLENRRFEEALKYGEEAIISCDGEINEEDRNLVVSCFKSYVNEKREAFKNILIIDMKERDAQSNHSKMITEIKVNCEESLYKLCEKQIIIINKYLLQKSNSVEDKVCYLKLKADNYRYMAEISTGELLLINKQNCTQFYRECIELTKSLSHMNVFKLGTYLNYSVYIYDVLKSPHLGLIYATYAVKKAFEEMKDNVRNPRYRSENKESLELLQILKENIHDWYLEVEGNKSMMYNEKNDKKNIFKRFIEKKKGEL